MLLNRMNFWLVAKAYHNIYFIFVIFQMAWQLLFNNFLKLCQNLVLNWRKKKRFWWKHDTTTCYTMIFILFNYIYYALYFHCFHVNVYFCWNIQLLQQKWQCVFSSFLFCTWRSSCIVIIWLFECEMVVVMIRYDQLHPWQARNLWFLCQTIAILNKEKISHPSHTFGGRHRWRISLSPLQFWVGKLWYKTAYNLFVTLYYNKYYITWETSSAMLEF